MRDTLLLKKFITERVIPLSEISSSYIKKIATNMAKKAPSPQISKIIDNKKIKALKDLEYIRAKRIFKNLEKARIK